MENISDKKLHYPRLEIDVKKLRNNTKTVTSLCHSHGLSVALVTKSFCAFKPIVEEITRDTFLGVDYIADSRIDNLKSLKDIELTKILLRIPMLNEVQDVVKYSDISFNSEILTIEKLNEAAKLNNKIHKIALMVDLGDLREGYFEKAELFEAVRSVLKMDNIKLIGIATNLTCYGAIIPTAENLQILSDIAEEIEQKFSVKLDFVSGGNSSSLYLLQRGDLPKGINNLRLGESIVLGRETAYGENIPGCYEDAFKLVCQIVELKNKPSVPIGTIGMDAFGNTPYYEDKGIRKRAILAIGKQDVQVDSLKCTDKKCSILGASSDHLILDVTDSDKKYKVGDEVAFDMSYGGLMSAAVSKYIYKLMKLEE